MSEIDKNLEQWFKITCPECGMVYECTYQGIGTHCYNYVTKEGIDIVGTIEKGELECPNCHKWSKEDKWNFNGDIKKAIKRLQEVE